MPVIIDAVGNFYRPFTYETEGEFEATVIGLADVIFGPSTIYVDVKKKVRGKDIVTIPDGYVIDMTEPSSPELYIVENEIVSHDPFKHIGIQLLKFVTSFEDAQLSVRNFLMQEISKDEAKVRRLQEGSKKSSSRNIDAYLDQAVYGSFRGLVVIDEARDELHSVLEKIRANISVLELKTFESEDGARLHLFDTLYDEEEEYVIETDGGDRHRRSKVTKEERAARRARRAQSDTIVVPAREEGFKRVFLGEDQWHAIRIGAAMKERIKYIAAYQAAPVSAVTHLAEVKEIRPYKDSGKYVVTFKGPAQEIRSVAPKESKNSPQGPVYVKREDLLDAPYLEKALS